MFRSSRSATVLPILLLGVSYVTLSVAEPVSVPLQNKQKNRFDVSVRTSVSYTDNRDQIDESEVARNDQGELLYKKESSTTFSIGPVFSYERVIDQRLKLKTAYSPSYEKESNPSPGDEDWNWDHYFDFGMEYIFNPRTSMTLKDRFSMTGANSYFYGSDYEFDPNRPERLSEDFYENRLSGSVTRLLSTKDSMTLSANWRIKRYDEKDYADYRDEDEYGFYVDWMHKAGRHLSYGVFAKYSSWDRENKLLEVGSQKVDVGLQYLVVGIQGSYDLNGNQDHYIFASFGFNHAWYDDDEQDDQNQLGDSRLEFRFFQRDPLRVLAGIRYGLDNSDVYPFSSQQDLASYLNLIYIFGSNEQYKLSAALEYRLRQYNLLDDLDPSAKSYGYYDALRERNNGSDDFDRTSVYFRLSADWKVNEWLTTSAFYSYESVECDIDTDYDENRLGVSATVRFL